MRKAVLATLVVATVLAGCGGTEGKFGAELYGESCARCHAADGSGIVGPSLGPGSDTDVELSDEQIRNVIRVGPGVMPSFGRLSDEQIDSLVRFIRSLSEDGS